MTSSGPDMGSLRAELQVGGGLTAERLEGEGGPGQAGGRMYLVGCAGAVRTVRRWSPDMGTKGAELQVGRRVQGCSIAVTCVGAVVG